MNAGPPLVGGRRPGACEHAERPSGGNVRPTWSDVRVRVDRERPGEVLPEQGPERLDLLQTLDLADLDDVLHHVRKAGSLGRVTGQMLLRRAHG